jgi:hypothetical protein
MISQRSPADLDRTIDLSVIHFGEQKLSFFIYAVLVGHPIMHAGEIAAYQGLQGLKGYPF